jgi:cyclase
MPYRAGLEEVADGVFAYLQPDGSWGWSNAGLVVAEDSSVLVDTLFDLPLTRRMLEAMRPLTDSRPIDALVNTHGNGDHCYGNQLAPATATIYASEAAAADMRAAPPQLLAGLMHTDLGPLLGPYMHRIFGPFQFDGIEMRMPDQLFSGRLEMKIGEQTIVLQQVGPAHTAGDTIVHVPSARVVFTGDILFVGGTPIMWDGPTENWLAACDVLLALDAATFIPGHGPTTDANGIREVQSYLRYVHSEATARYRAGMSADEAAHDISLGEFAELSDPERIVVNVESVYRELDPSRKPTSAGEMFERMARWARRHGL